MAMMIPIVVTPVGIVTAVSAVQYWKVLGPNYDDVVMVIGVTDDNDTDRGDSSRNYNRR